MEILEKSASDVVVIKGIVESFFKETLAKEIQNYFRNQLAEQQALQAGKRIQEKPELLITSHDHQLFERMVRVEEELKQNQVIIKVFIEQMDKRFETMQQSINQRFEQMDKRFETMQQSMDKRFETIQQSMDKRLDTMQQNMDKRFETMQQNMDKRFLMLQWFMGIGFGTIVSILGLLKLL